MSERIFVDTNILVYALDSSAKEKRKIAQKFLLDFWNSSEKPFISTQVLSELHVTLIKRGLAVSTSEKIVKDYTAWNVVRITESLIMAAIKQQEKAKVSYWDSLIITSAKFIKAEILLTEDLQNRQRFGGVKVLNPFL